MARTVAPLLSFEASGQIAKTQVYSRWKGRPYVRRYTVPSNPNTVDQQETRNTFAWLNDVYRMLPADVLLGWDAYADVQRFTGRNGFIKQNLSDLREETDLTNFIFSPAARGGPPATSMALTAGDDQITVDLVAPTLPSGWTIVQAVAAAIRQQDPQTGTLFNIVAGTDATSTYQVILTGLESAVEYVVGGWFQYLKPDGVNAYGQALMDTETTT